jgi:hypothetical protein
MHTYPHTNAYGDCVCECPECWGDWECICPKCARARCSAHGDVAGVLP